MASTPQRAGVYCRLSYAEDGTEEKVDRQEEDCRKLADRLAWPISEAHVFKDNNRSAWQRNRKRPGWDAMLAAIEMREIDSVIVYHGDRLIRQPFDLEKLINVADSKGIRIASVSGTRDLDNPDDRYILRIEAAGFCRSSDDSSRRVKRGLEARAARGMPRTGGTRAFGFERDNLTIRQSEADVIKEAGELLLAGATNYTALQWVNTVSTTTTGRRWTPLAFGQMMIRPRIAGILERNGEWLEAAWEPILDLEDWHLVRAILQSRKDDHGDQNHAITYLQSWIARCGSCGGVLTVKNHGGKHKKRQGKSYTCTNPDCPQRVSRSVANLDAYVVGVILELLNDPVFIEGLHAAGDDPALVAEIAALERRRNAAKQQLENLADFPEIDAGIVARSLASFDRKIGELRGRQAKTARRRLLRRMAGTTYEQWEAEPLDVRRATLAAAVRVEVFPTTHRGRGFDPDSVRVTPVEDDA